LYVLLFIIHSHSFVERYVT